MSLIKTVPVKHLIDHDPNKRVILDVRTKMEHLDKHIDAPHTHIPLDELSPEDFIKHHHLKTDAEVFILCRSGKRASQAAEKFLKAGYHNISVIDGGIIAYEDHGHPVKGHGNKSSNAQIKSPISLERQVRIIAGFLGATGSLMALMINPLFAIIPLIIGSGLLFAGLTDHCGMALLLTKAPWNHIPRDESSPHPLSKGQPSSAKGKESR